MADHTADVVIVGGGIAGCSAAHFLSEQGIKVVLIERDSIAAHASGFAFGVLLPRLFDDPSDPMGELTKRSLELHRQIASELSGDGGSDLRREKAAVLLALNDSEADQYRSIYRSRSSLLGDVRWLEHGELSHIEARIAPEVRGGLYLGDAAEISPDEFTTALWNSAANHGAELVNATVESIAANADGVTVTAGGVSYSAPRVIVAAGPWSTQLLEGLGVSVPVEPLKGQIVRLNAAGPPIRVSLWWSSDYAGSKPDGLVWCGTTEERAGFNEEPTEAAREGMLASARRVLPYLHDATVARQTACLRPVTLDGLPVVGPAGEHGNVVVATGGGRNGIVLGPALGRVAADIAAGNTPSTDVTLLGPERFRR